MPLDRWVFQVSSNAAAACCRLAAAAREACSEKVGVGLRSRGYAVLRGVGVQERATVSMHSALDGPRGFEPLTYGSGGAAAVSGTMFNCSDAMCTCAFVRTRPVATKGIGFRSLTTRPSARRKINHIIAP